MDTENDVWQGFVSSLVSNSKETNQTGYVLTSEDAAWVDSCLVKDPELSDGSWNALKDALLDILSFQPTSHYDTSAAESDGFPRGTYNELSPMIEEPGTALFPGGTDHDVVRISEEAETARILGETDDNLVPITEKTETAKFHSYLQNEFLSSYLDLPISEEAETSQILGETDDNPVPITEKAETTKFRSYLRNEFLSSYLDLQENEDTDVGVDLEPTNEIESSPENIFRVWDLDTPAEEDELVIQLTKALAESSFRALPVTLDGSVVDVNNETLDDLIAGMSDLSLQPSLG